MEYGAGMASRIAVSPLFVVAVGLWLAVIFWWLVRAARSGPTKACIGMQVLTVLLPVFTHRPVNLGPTDPGMVAWNIVVVAFCAILLGIAHFLRTEKWTEKLLAGAGLVLTIAAFAATIVFCSAGGRFPTWLAHVVPLIGFAGMWLNLEADFYLTKKFNDSPAALAAVWCMGFAALLLS